MNKRIIAPWKPFILVFGATILTVTAITMAIAATLTAPGHSPLSSDPHPKAAVSLTTPKWTPGAQATPRVISPQATVQASRGPVVTRVPTPAPTPVPAPATAPPPPVTRQPAAVDPPPAPTPIPGEYRPDITEQLYTMLNDERTSRGLSAVARNSSLISAAEHYARLIFLHDPYDLNHWLDGGSGDRAWSRGYCCGVGEILVESEGSAASMVDLWMNSAPHKGVILDPQYVVFGLACYGGPVIGDDGNLHYPIVCVGDFGSG